MKKKTVLASVLSANATSKTFWPTILKNAPGNMETPEGEVIGQHDGLMFYTNGQRQGLKIGGCKTSDGSPWYVVGRDTARNVLLVAQGKDHPLLYQRSLIAQTVHWINGTPPNFPAKLSAKTRYRQPDQACICKRWIKTESVLNLRFPNGPSHPVNRSFSMMAISVGRRNHCSWMRRAKRGAK